MSDSRANLAPRDGLSHVVGPTTPALRHITIPQMLRETVARFGARDALVLPLSGKTLTYGDLDRKVDVLAAGFLALGLAKGDRLGIWAPNREEWLLTQFATARIGVILVNINPAYRLSELEYALNKVGCKALVLAESFKTSAYLEMLRELAPEMATCAKGALASARLPHLKTVVVMSENAAAGAYSFAEVQALGTPEIRARLDAVTAMLEPDDPINIQFTSGTTGAPKGATLTHFNIVNNAGFVTGRINMTERDRLCIPVPLYHCFGMVMGTLGCVSKGAAMIFSGEAFDAAQTLSAISSTRCTAVYGVPTMFLAMLDEVGTGKYDLSSLRTGIMAGALCPVDIMRGVNDRMNMNEVTICYGMTETSPVSFQSFVDDPTEKRCATVGRIHPHLEVKIINAAGETVPVGEKGELCTRGYSVMHGYWEDSEKTEASIDAGGWMHTGDLAVLDAEGYCTITGRLKDMIIRGGENIYPAEIETFLRSHPDIHDAQVFGIPHEKFGEEVCAWIVPVKTGLAPAEVVEFCKGRIAHFKIPARIRIVQELPMTVTGKPQKFVMRNWMIENVNA